MTDILFELTKDHLETGLRGVPVGYCTTSSVDAQKGLFYMGRPVSELSAKSPEEVIYLLLYGANPSEEELQSFKSDLAKRSTLPESVQETIEHFPKQGHPMKWFSAALMALGMVSGTGDYREDCLNVIGALPGLVASVINTHAGWKGRPSDPSIGYMENFSQMLGVPNANLEALTEAMRLFNVLHYDHGGGNLSTFVGKSVASGLEDMYGSLSAAMNALAGPRHGKANQDCLDFVKQVASEVGDNPSEDDVESLIRKRLSNKQLVFGFGHAVLRVEDPRATVQYEVAERRYPENLLVKIACLLRKVGPKVLSENPKISNPYPNVDAISGTLLTAAGFPHPEYYTVLFGLSRCVGIARQIVYERVEARGGKGTPIVRPKYFFKSQAEALSFSR